MIGCFTLQKTNIQEGQQCNFTRCFILGIFQSSMNKMLWRIKLDKNKSFLDSLIFVDFVTSFFGCNFYMRVLHSKWIIFPGSCVLKMLQYIKRGEKNMYFLCKWTFHWGMYIWFFHSGYSQATVHVHQGTHWLVGGWTETGQRIRKEGQRPTGREGKVQKGQHHAVLNGCWLCGKTWASDCILTVYQ